MPRPTGVSHAYNSRIESSIPNNFRENNNPVRPNINPPIADLLGYSELDPELKIRGHSLIGIINNLDPRIVIKETVVNISKTDRKGIFLFMLKARTSISVTANDNM
jgi:hypothetical protein